MGCLARTVVFAVTVFVHQPAVAEVLLITERAFLFRLPCHE